MTITLPEWFVWLLACLCVLHAFCLIAGLYLRYLTKKIMALRPPAAPGQGEKK